MEKIEQKMTTKFFQKRNQIKEVFNSLESFPRKFNYINCLKKQLEN